MVQQLISSQFFSHFNLSQLSSSVGSSSSSPSSIFMEAFTCTFLEGRKRVGTAFGTKQRVFFPKVIWSAVKCASQIRADFGKKFSIPDTQSTASHFFRDSGLVLGMLKNCSLQLFLLFLHPGTTHFLSWPLISSLRGGAGTVIVNLRYSLEGLNGSDEGSLTREYSRLSILVPIVNLPLNDRY